MNIWYICKYVSYPGHGYVGMRGYYLMEELSKLGCNVDIVTSTASSFLRAEHKADASKLSPSLSFFQLTGLRYGSAGSIGRILSWLEFEAKVFLFNKKKLKKPDVVIVSSLSIFSIINGFIWSRVYRAKLVFEVRDIWPLTLTEEGGFSRYNPLIVALSLLERWAYSVSDLIIGTMPNMKAHVSSVYATEASKVICIPIGTPDDTLNPFFSSYVPETPPKKHQFVMGYVGTVGKTNALDTLFTALESIDLVQHNIEFHVVGDGPMLEHYVERYSHIDNLLFVGHVGKETVAEVISGFDVVYFSTFKSRVWEYGQSLNKLVDYMLAGKPILGSYSGFPSMINEAECGWFVPAEDHVALAEKIVALSAFDKDVLVKIGERGSKWIRENRRYSLLASDLLNHLRGL